MRKILAVAVPVFLVMVAFSVSLAWIMQARYAKATVKSWIEQVNQTQRIVNYERIDTSGFPFEVTVEIVKPKVTLPVGEWLKNWTIAQSTPADGMPDADLHHALLDLPPWTEEMALDGTLSLTVNAFSYQYAIRADGPVANQSMLGGRNTALLTQFKGERVCTVQFEHTGGAMAELWNFGRFSHNPEEMLRDFRFIDCHFSPQSTVDAQSNELIFQAGASRLHLEHDAGATSYAGGITAEMNDFEAAPRFEEMLSAYHAVLMPGKPVPTQFAQARFGKQSVKLDASWQLPKDQTQLMSAPLLLDVRDFSMTTALYDAAVSMKVHHTPSADKTALHVAVQSLLTAKPGYDDFVAESWKDAVREVLAEPALLEQFPALAQMTPEDVMTTVLNAAPKVEPLGTLKFALDVAYDGQPNFMKGLWTLKNFAMGATPYELSANGNMSAVPPPALSEGLVTFTCRNCDALIDDQFAYLRRLADAGALLAPEYAAGGAWLQKDINVGIKNFVHAVAMPGATGESLSIPVSNGPAGLTVGGKPMEQVMQLVTEHLGPYFPNEEAH